MKKVFLILLMLFAAFIYVWDGLLVVRSLKGAATGSPSAMPVHQASSPFHLVHSVHFVERGKNPFLPYKELPKPKISSADHPASSQLAPKKEAEPLPAISINGIMWSETNPVAIINLPDGSSTVAKTGQMILGNVLIKKIEKGQVTIVFGKKEYKLK